MSAAVTTTEPRTVEQIKQEIEAARLARESAAGRIKGNMTKAITKLERELAQVQESRANAERGDQPQPKKAKKARGKFDSSKLVEIIEKNGEPITVEAVAEAPGYERTGSLTNRLLWLARRDHLLREVEVRVEIDGKQKKVRAFVKA